MAEHRMRLEPGQPVPKATSVTIRLDEQGARRAIDQIPQSRTYRDGHGYVANFVPSKEQQLRARRQQPKISKFVTSFLEATSSSPVGMRKGDFVPHVFEPERPLLPLPGAHLTASQYLFLEREQQADEHVTVSADLVPLSKARSKSSPTPQRRQSRHTDVHDTEPAWRTLQHFKNWQNKALQTAMKDGVDEFKDQEIHDPGLQIQGTQQKAPEEPLNLEELDKLVDEVSDHSMIDGARKTLAHTQNTMEDASMQVLRDIAADRIDRFGCQEPGLVQMPLNKNNPYTNQFSDASVILATLRKPKPPVPAANIQIKYPKLQALMERRAAEKAQLEAQLAKAEAEKAEKERIAAEEEELRKAREEEEESSDEEVTYPEDAQNIQDLLRVQRLRQKRAARQRRDGTESKRKGMLTEN
eukprot:INCI11632.1.p1 GENE.INCI11632.1~~INCI11632.1.p1  ORF type:complete len:413 (-),score=76.76 INCI11632.1:1692-2930(-)